MGIYKSTEYELELKYRLIDNLTEYSDENNRELLRFFNSVIDVLTNLEVDEFNQSNKKNYLHHLNLTKSRLRDYRTGKSTFTEQKKEFLDDLYKAIGWVGNLEG
ncbi:hypothetical protein [Mucilaginibacter flavidus]|uniref:hypothetical protein n=1 Tax=Mucilaginibacter flavidus TaxID=2949309 RepID=UPI0020926DEC|nr:hypothetical protein [Mucilaginibacter flavidus]MCO5945341.1 hypothetical protein [Mucilaginibacter flavidus]